MDFAVSISQLQQHSSDLEKARVWEQIRLQTLLRFETKAEGTSDGAASWLTLWSGTCPTNASFAAKAQVVGRGATLGAMFEAAGGIEDFGGTAGLIGAGFTVTVSLPDTGGMGIQWIVTGSVLALQVRDDGSEPMGWRAFISGITTS